MSIASESSSYDQALALVGDMPFADKLRFNAELATLLKKEGKSGAMGKAAKREKKAKDPSAPKRVAAPGTKAWHAFVKHCKSEFADRFEGCTKETERLIICKTIKEENMDAYNAFVEKFKSSYSDEADDATPPEPTPATPPVAPLSAKEKLEKLKEAATAAKERSEKLKAASTPKKSEEKEKPEEEKPKKEVKKAASKKEEKPKKEVKKAASKKEEKKEEPPMPKKDIDGTEYWFDPDTNGLFTIQDGGFGAWVGYFQPDNEDEPIRFTESPADE